MATVAAGEGMAVAVLNRNEPAFYCVPARAYEELMDLVEDLELGRIADARLAMGRSRCRSVSMPFDLAFHPQALRSKLRGSTNRYKIKLRAAGFRLIYEVRDQQVLVLILAVGKRDRNAAYHQADQR